MAIGNMQGVTVDTQELRSMVQDGPVSVVVDHERFVVVGVAIRRSGQALVALEPEFGEASDVEVPAEAVDAPIWELA